MVSFEDEKVGFLEREPNLGSWAPQIRRDPDPGVGLLVNQSHGDRVRGVVNRQEGLDPDLADRERACCLIDNHCLAATKDLRTRKKCWLRNVYRRTVASTENTGTTSVIAVIVCDHDRLDRFGRVTRASEPPLKIATAEAGINQYCRSTGLYEYGVASTSRSEDADLHGLSWRVLFHASDRTVLAPAVSSTPLRDITRCAVSRKRSIS